MANVKLFIDSYLRSISDDFKVDVDKAFEIFSIAVILEKSFQEVFDDIITGGSEDGGIDGIDFIERSKAKQMPKLQLIFGIRLVIEILMTGRKFSLKIKASLILLNGENYSLTKERVN